MRDLTAEDLLQNGWILRSTLFDVRAGLLSSATDGDGYMLVFMDRATADTTAERTGNRAERLLEADLLAAKHSTPGVCVIRSRHDGTFDRRYWDFRA